jgi:hypothetical protein
MGRAGLVTCYYKVIFNQRKPTTIIIVVVVVGVIIIVIVIIVINYWQPLSQKYSLPFFSFFSCPIMDNLTRASRTLAGPNRSAMVGIKSRPRPRISGWVRGMCASYHSDTAGAGDAVFALLGRKWVGKHEKKKKINFKNNCTTINIKD